MEKDIKYLDNMVKEYKLFGYLHNPEYEDTDRIYQAIENLIKGHRILEFENQALQNTKDTCPNMATSGIRCDIKKNFIPKSKIKEIVDKNLRQNALVGCEGYCYGFNECQQLAKEIVELMEDK